MLNQFRACRWVFVLAFVGCSPGGNPSSGGGSGSGGDGQAGDNGAAGASAAGSTGSGGATNPGSGGQPGASRGGSGAAATGGSGSGGGTTGAGGNSTGTGGGTSTGGGTGTGGGAGAANLVPTIVAVGWNGWRVRSRDLGRTWTDRIKITQTNTYDKTNLYRSVTWGAGMFVAVGEYITASPDGATWTVANTPPHMIKTSQAWGYLSGVAFGNGVFVAVGGVAKWFDTGNPVMTSKDGMNWAYAGRTCTNCTDTDVLGSVAFGNGMFVTTMDSGKAFSSTDGVTWAPFPGFTGGSVSYCGGAFKSKSQCQPWTGHGVSIGRYGDVLRWSIDAGKTWRNSNYTEPNPSVWADTADWLAFGYSAE